MCIIQEFQGLTVPYLAVLCLTLPSLSLHPQTLHFFAFIDEIETLVQAEHKTLI